MSMLELDIDSQANKNPSSLSTSNQASIIPSFRSKFIQYFGQLAIALPMIASVPGCSVEKNETKEANGMSQLTALEKNSANALSMWLAQTILEETAGQILDELGKERLRIRLGALESSLAQSDATLAKEILATRNTLDRKADVSDVRRIVQQVLTEMEKQCTGIDAGITLHDLRIKRDTDLFGYLPTVTPSPLLQQGAETKNIAHPKVIEWAKLLCLSETHRTKMEDLSRIYKENAPEMQEAMAVWEALKRESSELHFSIEIQLAQKLTERIKLSETRKPTHPDIKQFDAEIASLAWLSVITRPEKSGRYTGAMTVPSDLVGPAASDIVAAFKLAGENEQSIVPLYQQLINVMPGPEKEINTFRRNQKSPSANLMPNIGAIEKRYQDYSIEIVDTLKNAQMLDNTLKKLLLTLSPLHPDVQKILKMKEVIFSKLQLQHQIGNRLLNDALHSYIENLKEYRPAHEDMREYNRTILGPLNEIVNHCSCFDWNNPQSRNEMWDKFQHLDLVCAIKFGTIQESIEKRLPRGTNKKWEPVQDITKSEFSHLFDSNNFEGRINRNAKIAFLWEERKDFVIIYDTHKEAILRVANCAYNDLYEINDQGSFATFSKVRSDMHNPHGLISHEFRWSIAPFTE